MTLASLDRFAENVRVLAVVIPELEFSDIERHVFAAHFVERPDHAALEDRPEALNGVGMDRADDVLPSRVVDNFVLRKFVGKMLIADPMIRNEEADLFRDAIANEGREGIGSNVRDHTRHHVAPALHGSCDNRLALSARTAASVPALAFMSVLGLPADEGLIHFHYAHELAEFLIGEAGSDAVAHVERGLIGAETHDAIDLQGGDALLAGEHHVDDAEPLPKWLVRVLKDRPCDMGELIAVRIAAVALPFERPASDGVIGARSAAWASNALRPAMSHQIGAASLLVGKSRFPLGDRHLVDSLMFQGHSRNLHDRKDILA